MKFCKDCKWLKQSYPLLEEAYTNHGWSEAISRLYQCRRGRNYQDFVTANVIYSKAKDMREVGGLCGPEGKLWEPKKTS